MSYILNALRKSERERQRSEARPLVRLSDATPAEPKASWRSWAFGALIGINVAALVYIVVLHVGKVRFPFVSQDSARKAGSAEIAPAVAVRHAVAPEEGPAPKNAHTQSDPPTPPVRQTPEAPSPAQPPIRRTKPERVLAEMHRDYKPSVVKSDDRPWVAPPRRLPENPTDAVAAPPRAAEPAPRLSSPGTANPIEELSQEVRARLPGLKVSVYAYSPRLPAEGFVVIAGRKYRVGERVEGGPMIRRIGENEMILEFEGETFRVPRP